MSEKKFFEIQQQVRRDNQDLQDFVRDLNNWEKDIKRKDDELRKTTPESDERILPPVRNQDNQHNKKRQRKKKKPDTAATAADKVKAKETKQNGKSEEKKQRIGGYDYRSWDKFDVDKACAEVDSDEGEKESSDTTEYETDSDLEREMEERRRKIQEAISEKDKGNALFKQGNYEQALICYSAGIEADPSNGILPANRAMALLKLKRYSEAETDCDKAISLDCTYVKAYARRGAARIELGKLEEAKKDFQQVLNLEASNKQAISEIKRIDKLLRQKEERMKKAEEPSNIVRAIEKPIHLRSSKPLKRITIEEIGTGPESPSLSSEQATAKKEDSVQINSTKSSAKGDNTVVHAKSNSSKAGSVADETDRLCHKSGQNSEVETTESSSSKRNQAATSSSSEFSLPASSPPSIPPVPKSSFQLQADWKKLDRYPELLYQYFKEIPPEKLPSLFQQSLDAGMLMKILEVLRQHYIPNQEPIYAVLKHLSAVKRFDMNIMFMSKKEKQVVAEIIEYCKTSKSQTDEELNVLTKKYGL